jgi:hypothetical protein
MTQDLRGLLNSWPYHAQKTARIIKGDDGRDILQVRLPLGLEQYELTGRPDGQKPYGQESIFDFHLARLAKVRALGHNARFELNPEMCAELFNEGMIYYHRYLHLFQLKDWGRAARDTARNLRLFDFVRQYAEQESDRLHLEKWRPYILRMNAVATAMIQWEAGLYDQALATVQAAVRRLQLIEECEDETFKFEQERSLIALQELAREIQNSRPVTEIQSLELEMKKAIETQEFERAAELRDRLRELRQPKRPKSSTPGL